MTQNGDGYLTTDLKVWTIIITMLGDYFLYYSNMHISMLLYRANLIRRNIFVDRRCSRKINLDAKLCCRLTET